jgi:hypothetical protein
MTVAATALWLISLLTGSSLAILGVIAIGAVMVLFPALESVFGICVGCLLFAGLMRLGVIPEEVCLECADITKRRERLLAERARQQAA